MALGDRLKRCPEVSERLDVIELAGLDEAGDAGPGLRAVIVSCEQMILSAARRSGARRDWWRSVRSAL